MASSVVRIEEKTHAALRKLAEQKHKPIGQIVTELVERQVTEQFWQEMREDFARLRADPVAWKDYQGEAALWETATNDSLNDEEPYYSAEEEAEIEADAKSRGW